jgi:hypothetical protein
VLIPRWFMVVNGVALGIAALLAPFAIGWFAWATTQLISIGVKVERLATFEAGWSEHLADYGRLEQRMQSVEAYFREGAAPLLAPKP